MVAGAQALETLRVQNTFMRKLVVLLLVALVLLLAGTFGLTVTAIQLTKDVVVESNLLQTPSGEPVLVGSSDFSVGSNGEFQQTGVSGGRRLSNGGNSHVATEMYKQIVHLDITLSFDPTGEQTLPVSCERAEEAKDALVHGTNEYIVDEANHVNNTEASGIDVGAVQILSCLQLEALGIFSQSGSMFMSCTVCTTTPDDLVWELTCDYVDGDCIFFCNVNYDVVRAGNLSSRRMLWDRAGRADVPIGSVERALQDKHVGGNS